MRKSRGPSIDPCGTPAKTGCHVDIYHEGFSSFLVHACLKLLLNVSPKYNNHINYVKWVYLLTQIENLSTYFFKNNGKLVFLVPFSGMLS